MTSVCRTRPAAETIELLGIPRSPATCASPIGPLSNLQWPRTGPWLVRELPTGAATELHIADNCNLSPWESSTLSETTADEGVVE